MLSQCDLAFMASLNERDRRPTSTPPLEGGESLYLGEGRIGRSEKCFMFYVSWGNVSCCIYAVFRLVLYISERFCWFYAGNCA